MICCPSKDNFAAGFVCENPRRRQKSYDCDNSSRPFARLCVTGNTPTAQTDILAATYYASCNSLCNEKNFDSTTDISAVTDYFLAGVLEKETTLIV